MPEKESTWVISRCIFDSLSLIKRPPQAAAACRSPTGGPFPRCALLLSIRTHPPPPGHHEIGAHIIILTTVLNPRCRFSRHVIIHISRISSKNMKILVTHSPLLAILSPQKHEDPRRSLMQCAPRRPPHHRAVSLSGQCRSSIRHIGGGLFWRPRQFLSFPRQLRDAVARRPANEYFPIHRGVPLL